MENRPRILVVDDEESIRGILNETLDMIGCEVIEAASAEEAMKEIKAHAFHLIMTDIRMPGLSGMDLLKKVRAIPLETEVIIMTSHASLETAIQAMRLGAYDYLLKPFEELDWVAAVVQRALEKRRLEAENKRLVNELVQKNQDLAQATKKAAVLLSEAATGYQQIMGLFAPQPMEALQQKMVETVSHLLKDRPTVLFSYSMETHELLARNGASLGQKEVADLRVNLSKVPRAASWFEKREYAPLLVKLFQEQFGSAILDVPLAGSSVNNGVLVVCEGSAGAFSSREAELLEQFARLAAAVLKQRGAEPRSEPPKEMEYKISVRDGATALFSLPYFQEYLEQEILRARRYRHPFSLCAVLIEGGGEAPEREKILKDTAALIQKRVRQSDLAARSGDRFFLLLPETSKEWGAKVVNSLQRKLSEFGQIQHPPAQVKTAIADYPRDADTSVGLMTLVETMIQQKKS